MSRGSKPRKRWKRDFEEYWSSYWQEVEDCEANGRPLKQNRILEHAAHGNDEIAEPTMGVRADMGDEIKRQTEIQASNKKMQLQAMKNDSGKKDQQAKEDRLALEEATKSFGGGRCRAKNGRWALVPVGKRIRFTSTLYNHQVMGVSWMLSRETSFKPPRGGILADEMGLGKTVQVLACMSQNLPDYKAEKRGHQMTLIICPKSLISQWVREIEKHHDSRFGPTYSRYAGSKHCDQSSWRRNDIL